jgi:ribonuclease R
MKNQENTETKIIALFGNNFDKKFTFDNLKSLLPKTIRREKLIHALLVLKKQKRIVELEMDVYQLNPKEPPAKPAITITKSPIIQENKIPAKKTSETFEGILDITQSGAMFVIIDGLDRDAIIRNKSIPAFAGDRIEVKVDRKKEGKRAEATFIRVIDRKIKEFVGKFSVQKSKEFEVFFVQPLTAKVSFDFYIPSKYINNAKDGDYVEVELIEWNEGEKNPRGRVIDVIKDFNPNELQMRSILLSKGFHQEFDEQVLSELKSISKKIPQSEIEDRLDLRGITTLTIDPKTAKDFDDALSIEKLEDGMYEIGVHIADVSYYVPYNSAVDKEAAHRATSVYLPDRVAPMLPEILSNDLCSLNPNQDRLAFSVMYKIDDHGKIHDAYIAKTIIHSDRRFAYEDAQAIIESGKGDYADEVLTLWKIASIWRKERFEKGAINFESPEVQFVLDEKKVPIDIIPKVQQEANWLIEEFMLRANVTVALALDGYTKAKKIPAGVYRNHDTPDMAKLEQFRETALRLGGHKMQKIDKVENASKVLNEFLATISNSPESDILNQLAIRSMSKAVYSTENIGHYGLAYTHYSHFTSPIRRYPDLLAHRLLTDIMKKNKSPYTAAQLEELSVLCSEQEKKATECEREGIKYKQMEYMSHRIGKYYKGIISGMNGAGFWVELKDNKCEGFVELAKNFQEQFVFDPSKMVLDSSNRKIQFHMGQDVEIKIDKVDLEGKKTWFTIVNY